MDMLNVTNELFDVFTEIEARYVSNNIAIPEFQNLSWTELCDKGIEILEVLKNE